MGRYLKSGDVPEWMIQQSIVSYLRWLGHGDFIIRIYNEGAGIVKNGQKEYSMGLRPGASDLFLMIAKHDKHGLWMEIKSKNGRMSEAQKKFFKDAEAQNYMTVAVWSFDEAKKFLDWYLG